MRFSKLFALAPLLLILTLPIHAQEQWEKIAPLGEPFTVSMPTFAQNVTRLIPLSATDAVPARVLYSVDDGRRYAIVSFARTTGNRTPALSNFPEFAVAMEWSLTRAEGTTGTVTFHEDLSQGSRVIKQYHLQVGEYRGVSRLIGTESSFYALVVTGADANDSNAQRFLNSFVLGKTNDDDEPKATKVITRSGGYADGELPPEPWPRKFSYISGGVLNGKAVLLAKPEYPEAGRKNRDEGVVKVRIVIDGLGKVISAEAIEGPESLREEAVKAAFRSEFSPTRLSGQLIHVSGVIVYNFVAQ